ncbi:16S rRNA (uracil(1498)-N(3))-methyltransferase [Staphylococcus intermedius]|uniref:Ribosomal RNA small subunit methyltransferase E n=1 Tax=Staphylococcus intermedius NCTC 11048 TaxID=1141106 RepID=A0A380G8E7_STAIN|nr:16S rRNA (uracil(1498)-N(3))-methyltransferase [Staphylococcus intermedius]PCF64785.1 16S rRNA (uracil(1498)-N(3))-methyltransferase [Staphylococcus intermedius]PCF80395.1 16S rRNA (uracil(1498)-N(3))-methyltransferase [Staphylococcus intermedius]PCF81745.1 16S rRNA (uracil(1498)-N(3))-methyltransferase [Staphylococcus intermedius]PCF88083.1 16S rRNA (uracil(1498)-N(3))-methyltransferase [Staphylococcus intermedius]PNZ51619.1 16S rRNA (uracil(1498)-N(3))-methyltransferase [Staphylococcus in
MQRYFLNENADTAQRFFITDSNDIHHIKSVMRQAVGDELIINFLDEQTYRCKIIAIEAQQITIETVERLELQTELPVKITICSGLIKGDKYEWLLQKATELGATSFITTQMDRSVVKLNQQKASKKVERWQKIVKEAAEQSYRQVIPQVKFVSNLQEIYDMIGQYDCVLMAYEAAAKENERAMFKQQLRQLNHGAQVLLLFGPEGGFSDDEIALFENVANSVGLGPRILRAETAPLYALSAISYEIELMG